MFGVSKKLAASMAELLIILAIVGILSVLYRNIINEDAIAVKAGYRTVLNSMINFATTETDTYERSLGRRSVCQRMSEMVNTLGEINCNFSIVPSVPNFTTTSGLRFFGLEQIFQNTDNFGERSIFVSVDIDGLMGANEFEKDVFPIELTQSGRIRPSGSAVRNESGAQSMQGNVARDAELYAINLSYVPAGAQGRDDFLVVGNRISYSEAQCLGGNPFPYREANPPHSIQMCIEDAGVRNAINAFNTSFPVAVRNNLRAALTDLNNDGVINVNDRDEFIRRYRRDLALEDGIICSSLYNNANSVANGLTPINDDGIARCRYCYKIAYIQDYCASLADVWEDEAAGIRRRDAVGDEICPEGIYDAQDAEGNLLREGMCSSPQWAERINQADGII